MSANGSSGDADLADDEAGDDADPAGGAESRPGSRPAGRRSRACGGAASAACWWTAPRWPSRTWRATGSRAGRTIEVVVDRVKLDHDVLQPPHRFGGDLVPRRRRRGVCRGARRRRRARLAHRVLGEVRMPDVRHRLRDAAAAAVLLQQPVRRLRHVQRLRQHHRARHGARGARPVEVDQPGRHRAVDQAALPQPSGRVEAHGQEVGPPARRALVGAHRRRARGWSSRATATTTAFAASSAGSSGRNTRCTSACS